MTTRPPESERTDAGQGQAEQGRPSSGGRPPAWLQDILEAAAALRELAAAQWSLFSAELALARSATYALLWASLVTTVFAVALGLTLLTLAGWGLTQWLGSWAWGLAVLAALQILCLGVAIWFTRRCLHWMTLPESRAHLRALVRQTSSLGERDAHATDSSKK